MKRERALRMLSDENECHRHLRGGEESDGVLVRKYGNVLACYINGFVKDPNEAEKLTFEAFAQLFSRKCPTESSGRVFLYRTARSLALRYKNRQSLILLPGRHTDFEPQNELLIRHAAAWGEQNCRFYAALKKLKAEYREPLYLVYFEDMTYREAAEVMSKNERQVRTLVSRGIKSLKLLSGLVSSI